MKAEIITIGDEILIGQIVDTNSAWMGNMLNEAGIKVHQITSVADDETHILSALKEASQRVKIVLITGGLGPTKDDVTKSALCKYFNTSLSVNEEAYSNIEMLFQKRGRPMNNVGRSQAELPQGCIVLINKMGTASGMWFEKDGVIFISMPGVPYEMKYLMEAEVIPRLKSKFERPFILHRTFQTFGVGESIIAETIKDFENELPSGYRLAYLPAPGCVRLRISASGNESEVRSTMQMLENRLTPLISDYLFGFENDTLETVLGKILLDKKLTVSTAESCTGGYIGHLLSSVPGSSSYYYGSTVTYSYESKTKVLGVPEEMIYKHGAVSEEVVLAMAESVKQLMGTSCSVATSGIAGPSGGTPEKPVGTVWIGISSPEGTFAKKIHIGDNRLRNIQVASMTALNLLRKELLVKG